MRTLFLLPVCFFLLKNITTEDQRRFVQNPPFKISSETFLKNLSTKEGEITPGPEADFIADPISLCEGQNVQFTDQSSNVINGLYEWYFPGGDPATSTDQNPLVNYPNAGSYDVTLIVFSGLDSDTLTINDFIEVLPSETTNLEASICFGETYFFNGQNLDVSGTYLDTLPSTGTGCDTIVSLDLTVRPEVITNLEAEICEDDTYLFDGQMLDVGGTYTAVFTDTNGCDSTVILELTILQHVESDVQVGICAGGSYNFNGTILTAAGTYLDTIMASNGCDSFISLELMITPFVETFLIEDICDGENFNFNGEILTQTGMYMDTLVANSGCDSIVHLDLTVNPNVTTNLDVSICEGESYLFDGQNLTTSGSYIAFLATSEICDSTVMLELTVLPVSNENIAVEICEGEVYNFNGQMLDTSGIYSDTLVASNSCDSILTLELTVNEIDTTFLNENICEGEVYLFNNQALDQSGTYIAVLNASTGCDSIVNLELTVLPGEETSSMAEICEGEIYVFQGQDLEIAGTYSDTLQAANGCDSILVLELTVLPLSQTNLSAQICEGESYFFNGVNLTIDGTYLDTLSAANGCDSIVTLELMVLPELSTTINAEICEGETFLFDNQMLEEAGTYFDTLQSIAGCDSISVLNLEVLMPVQTSIAASICFGTTYDFNGVELDASGTYFDTLTASNGCDSLVQLELMLLAEIESELEAQICFGETFNFEGNILNASGVYRDTLISAAGCDSILILNLTILPLNEVTVQREICTGSTFNFNGTILSDAGTYMDTLLDRNGCDSFITLNLSFNNFLQSFPSVSICNGETYNFNGQFLDQSGTYLDTLPTSSGCDSFINLTLTVLPRLSSEFEREICFGEFFLFNGINRTETGSYSDTLLSVDGCDSLVTLNLLVLPESMSLTRDTICEGMTYDFNGQTYSTSGIFVATLTGVNGCDSLAALNLRILPAAMSTTMENICEGEVFSFNGQDFDSTGIYEVFIPASSGCDSIARLELNVFPSTMSVTNESICEGTSILFNGQEYDSTGIYEVVLQNSNGCDSIASLQLLVLENTTSLTLDSICEGQTYDFNGLMLDSSGMYEVVLVNSEGCDSIAELDLRIIEGPTANFDFEITDSLVMFENFSLNVDSVLWDFGDGNTSNEFNPQHIYDTTGVYTAQLTVFNDCGNNTIQNTVVIMLTAVQNTIFQTFEVYPNPVRDHLILKVPETLSPNSPLRIIDLEGKTVFNGQISNGMNSIEVSNLPDGIYQLVYYNGGVIFRSRFVKM
jgi:PKD repeat protein